MNDLLSVRNLGGRVMLLVLFVRFLQINMAQLREFHCLDLGCVAGMVTISPVKGGIT